MPQLLDTEQVFPKRLGIMHGNTLVLEYYHLQKDKFKKHAMPFETGKDPKLIVEELFKSPQHAPYLKKVNPKHVRSVLQGNSLGIVKQQSNNGFPQFASAAKSQNNQPLQIYQREKEPIEEQKIIHTKVTPQQTPIINFAPIKTTETFHKKREQADQYYNEQFEQFQISVSVDKSNHHFTLSKQPSLSPKNSTSEKSSQIEKSSSMVSKSNDPQPPKTKGKKAAVQQIVQEYDDDFEFLDEDASKKKKGKSKQKKGKKSKSKEKGQKKVEEKKKVEPKQTEIEEQFQFL